MVTPHAVTAVSNAELRAARHWLSTSGSRDVEVEVIAELPPSVVYRALAGRYDGGWPQFQRDSDATRCVPAEHGGAAMRSTSAEGARDQTSEHAPLGETPWRECGRTEALACPQVVAPGDPAATRRRPGSAAQASQIRGSRREEHADA